MAVAISACGQRQDTGPEASSPDELRSTANSDSLPVRRLEAPAAALYRINSGIRDTTFTVVHDPIRWQAMWRRLTAQHSPLRSAPPIDFEKETALVATLGEQRTGGYRITIDAAIDRGAYVEAHISRRAPGRGCGVTGMITTPADVAIVPRRDVNVHVVTRDHVIECSTR